MTTQFFRTTRLPLVGAVALMAGTLSTTADAQTIEACYQQTTGQLRVVGSSNDCKGSEVAISWNVTGPPGPGGTVTPPLILEGSVQGGLIEASNPNGQYGVVGTGGVAGLFGKGAGTGVRGEGASTGVSGFAGSSASRGGRFESGGALGVGVIATALHTSIPGTGVLASAADGVFVPPGQPPVIGVGVESSGYVGIIGMGRATASPGFSDMALQGAGVQGFGYFGIFGRSTNGFAGFFEGNVHVTGDLSATSVNQSSDRALKENFTPVDGRGILRRVGDMPIHAWNYTERPGIRHIGPTAQDFYKAFGLGGDDRHITTIDEAGVALVAIQSLYELQLEKEQEMKALREELESLKAELKQLRDR